MLWMDPSCLCIPETSASLCGSLSPSSWDFCRPEPGGLRLKGNVHMPALAFSPERPLCSPEAWRSRWASRHFSYPNSLRYLARPTHPHCLLPFSTGLSSPGELVIQCLLGNNSVSQQRATPSACIAPGRERSPRSPCVCVSFRHSCVWQ